jgi:hypothetical protein
VTPAEAGQCTFCHEPLYQGNPMVVNCPMNCGCEECTPNATCGRCAKLSHVACDRFVERMVGYGVQSATAA